MSRKHVSNEMLFLEIDNSEEVKSRNVSISCSGKLIFFFDKSNNNYPTPIYLEKYINMYSGLFCYTTGVRFYSQPTDK